MGTGVVVALRDYLNKIAPLPPPDVPEAAIEPPVREEIPVPEPVEDLPTPAVDDAMDAPTQDNAVPELASEPELAPPSDTPSLSPYLNFSLSLYLNFAPAEAAVEPEPSPEPEPVLELAPAEAPVEPEPTTIYISAAHTTIKNAGYESTALISHHVMALTPKDVSNLREAGITSIFNIHPEDPEVSVEGMTAYRRSDFVKGAASVDSFINIDPIYDATLHGIGTSKAISELVRRRRMPIAFLDADPIFPGTKSPQLEKARAVSSILRYCMRSALKGHYMEFGTWFGRTFYQNCFLLKQQLEGEFWAFDSFGGLSEPNDTELVYSNDDFAEGRYFCNLATFDIIRDQIRAPRHRIKRVPGYFDTSLRGKTIADYGIAPRSVSVCLVDCDLYEPTIDILNFIYDGLEDGALLYFDDIRLGRAANKASEYDALRRWLKQHPEVELLPFPTISWQAQWFIFNRYTDG